MSCVCECNSWVNLLLEIVPSLLLLLLGGGACVKFRENIRRFFSREDRQGLLKNDSVTTIAAKHILNKSVA